MRIKWSEQWDSVLDCKISAWMSNLCPFLFPMVLSRARNLIAVLFVSEWAEAELSRANFLGSLGKLMVVDQNGFAACLNVKV